MYFFLQVLSVDDDSFKVTLICVSCVAEEALLGCFVADDANHDGQADRLQNEDHRTAQSGYAGITSHIVLPRVLTLSFLI
jgi:hypothetical protein